MLFSTFFKSCSQKGQSVGVQLQCIIKMQRNTVLSSKQEGRRLARSPEYTTYVMSSQNFVRTANAFACGFRN